MEFSEFCFEFLRLKPDGRAEFIAEVLESLGLSPEIEKIPWANDFNVIAKPERESEVVIVAHHDGPGANDNATGSYTLLKLAEILGEFGNVEFVSTGAEERGLLGALSFVSKNRDRLAEASAVINIDSVGVGPMFFLFSTPERDKQQAKLEMLALRVATEMRLPTMIWRKKVVRDEIVFHGVAPVIGLSWRNEDGTLPLAHSSQDVPDAVDTEKVRMTIEFTSKVAKRLTASR